MNDVYAFVLAGGKSSRMGQDKGLLRFAGRTLLESALERLRKITENVFIVGTRPDLACYAPVVPDLYPNCGPLGGIHAALCASSADLNLVLAVDMPAVPAELLVKLAAVARESQAVVTVPRTSAGLQPLCALYRAQFLPLAEAALKSGSYRIDRLFPQGKTRVVDEDELSRWGHTAEVFHNLNSPEDIGQVVPQAGGLE